MSQLFTTAASGPTPTPPLLPPLQLPSEAVESSLVRLAEELPGALREGDQEGILHARKLTTCIQASGGWGRRNVSWMHVPNGAPCVVQHPRVWCTDNTKCRCSRMAEVFSVLQCCTATMSTC